MEDLVEMHPSARQTYDADLSEGLGDTDTALASEGVTATNTAGNDVTSTIIGAISKSGLVLTATFRDVVHGEDYKVLFRAVGNVTARVATKTVELRARSDLQGNL